jgi:hypothetical protein
MEESLNMQNQSSRRGGYLIKFTEEIKVYFKDK